MIWAGASSLRQAGPVSSNIFLKSKGWNGVMVGPEVIPVSAKTQYLTV
jgi:hypothetical protein